MMKNSIHIALATTLFALCACTSPKEKKPPSPPLSWLPDFEKILPKKKPKPPAAMPVDWAGTIRMVNRNENFALVETQSATACVVGEKYISVQSGTESGILLITSLKAHPFLIADIVEGDPSDGDKIYLPRSGWFRQAQSTPLLPDETPAPSTE